MPTHILHRLRWKLPAVLLGVLVPGITYAQAGGSFPVDSTYATISNWTLIAAEFLNLMTWFVFTFLIFLLDPRFIFDMGSSGGGSLMTMLNLIWQLSRNLMNVAFAVGLVGAAIYTVVTANKEFVSAHLKTFIMAVVLVNFSWFIPRVVLDIANVATATVYSIPSAIVDPTAGCWYVSTNLRGCMDPGAKPDGTYSCACKAVADFEPFPGSDVATALKSDPSKGWECNLAYCIRYVKLNAATSTRHGAVLNGLIVNHARLPQLATVTRTAVDDDIADLLLFILRELVVVVIHIAIFFPLAALLLALIIRIPILWLTMAFMPFYFLTWVIPDELPLGFVKEKAKLVWDWFLKAAFLPAAVAIPLTIGYIMANAGSRVTFAGIDDISFNLIDGMGTFGQLLWVMMVLAILWSGTFMVLETMTAGMPGASLIGSIKSTGEGLGKFAAELPLSTVPIPGVGNLLNMKDMMRPEVLSGALRHRDGFFAGVKSAVTPSGRESAVAKDAATRLKGDDTKKQKVVKSVEDFSRTKDFEKLQRELAAENITVTKDNFHRIIQELHANLSRGGGPGLATDAKMRAFNDAVASLMPRPAVAPAPAPAPATPPPAAPPAAGAPPTP